MTSDECKQCPECNHTKFINVDELGDGFRNCANCGQEWWTNIDYTDTIWQPISTAKHSQTVLMFAVGETYWIGSRCHNGVIYIHGDADPDSGTTLRPDEKHDDDLRIVAWTPLPKKPFTYKHGLSDDDISKLLEKL